jgi:transcription elongation factor GreA
MEEIMLTLDGKKQLEARLETLKVVSRKEVADRIKEAREFGDISENSEYDAAKEEQAMIEGEILDIEQKLASAKIIEEDKDISVIKIGSTVRLLDVELKEETIFKIVGTAESDPMNDLISNDSPVGKALLGAKKGAEIVVDTPSGKTLFTVVEILKKK